VSNLNELTLLHETEAYLKGLIVFGSYYPYKRKYKDPLAARQDTIVIYLLNTDQNISGCTGPYQFVEVEST
jgi:hypothetical protein